MASVLDGLKQVAGIACCKILPEDGAAGEIRTMKAD
jgi:hypothetical protein